MKHRFFQVLIIVVIVSGAVLLYKHNSTHAASPQPLSITITSTPPVALPGQSIIVTITSTNTQAQEIKDVTLKDIIPPGAVYIKKLSGIDPAFDGKTLTWKIPSIPPNNSNIIQFQAKVITDPINIFVAPNGNNSTGTGTIDKPYLTIDRARDNIRTLKQQEALTAPATINIKSGTYGLGKSLDFTTYDSGTNNTPITYQGYGGETTISGSKKITSSWTKCTANDVNCNGLSTAAKTNVYYTDLTTDPYFKDHPTEFNSLFTNEERAIRARMPNEGEFFNVKSSNINPATGKAEYDPALSHSNYIFTYQNNDISSSWTNLTDVEIIDLQQFASSRKKIGAVDSVNKKVSLNRGLLGAVYTYDYDLNCQNDPEKKCTRYYAENVFEGLDAPTEWYFNKATKRLYYLPKEGIIPDQSKITIPVVEQLATISGNAEVIPNDSSISMWVKTNREIGSDGKYTDVSSVALYSNEPWYNRVGHKIILDQWGNLVYQFYTADGAVVDEKNLIVPSNSEVLANNTWYHVAFAFDSTNKTVTTFVDGKQKLTVDLDPAFQPSLNMPMIGATGGNSSVITSIDELKMFGKAINVDEANDLYTNNTSSTATPISSLSFEDNLNDSTGNFVWNVGSWEIAPQYGAGKIGRGRLTQKPTNTSNTDQGIYIGTKKNWDTSGFVHDINFTNLTFQNSDWKMADKGLDGLQSNWASPVLPAVDIKYASRINFSNNKIKYTAGSGVSSTWGDNISIQKNYISDVGECGIKLGETWRNAFYSKDNQIIDNTIDGIGKTSAVASGIVVTRATRTDVSHNEIKNGGFIGIALGQWASDAVSDNVISFNHIYNVMQVQNDGAGIYVSGSLPNTKVLNNKIHDVKLTPLHINDHIIAGIYTDGKTEHIDIENNISYNNDYNLMMNGNASDIKVVNNIFAKARISEAILYNYNTTNSTIEKNIFSKTADNYLYKIYWASTPITHQDNNLYYDPSNSYKISRPETVGNTTTYVDDTLSWLKNNFQLDQHSLQADPLFVDSANNDYSLQSNSTALKSITQGGIGFQSIDMSTVGPR